MRTGEEPGQDVAAQVDAVERGATPDMLPRMFGVLEDDDPYGLLWSIFYVMEGMDDAYLQAFIAAVPGLEERAPGWAETALLRVVNTRDEPEDCTEAFEAIVRAADDTTRALVAAIATRLMDSEDAGLSGSQRRSLQASVAAFEVS
ncbi:MAG: hypothetical protein JKY37_21990 [Nannocystaceae bacterium]|nr:hypothetical protein [Nannocystaceae bacterium]